MSELGRNFYFEPACLVCQLSWILVKFEFVFHNFGF